MIWLEDTSIKRFDMPVESEELGEVGNDETKILPLMSAYNAKLLKFLSLDEINKNVRLSITNTEVDENEVVHTDFMKLEVRACSKEDFEKVDALSQYEKEFKSRVDNQFSFCFEGTEKLFIKG
jgi:hypothetical protein